MLKLLGMPTQDLEKQQYRKSTGEDGEDLCHVIAIRFLISCSKKQAKMNEAVETCKTMDDGSVASVSDAEPPCTDR